MKSVIKHCCPFCLQELLPDSTECVCGEDFCVEAHAIVTCGIVTRNDKEIVLTPEEMQELAFMVEKDKLIDDFKTWLACAKDPALQVRRADYALHKHLAETFEYCSEDPCYHDALGEHIANMLTTEQTNIFKSK